MTRTRRSVLGDPHQTLRLRAHLTYHDHAGSIRIVAIEGSGDIYIGNIPFLQNGLLGGNAVADHVIYGNADALGEALVVQAGGIATSVHDVVMDGLVNLIGGDTGLRHAHCQVKGTVIYHASGPDGLDIFLIIDDLLGRAHLTLEEIELYLVNALIKRLMALLVLLAAATPAKVISRHESYYLLYHSDTPLPRPMQSSIFHYNAIAQILSIDNSI